MNRVPCVHVLIVNWNGRHHLEACLPSVLRSRYPHVRVQVIDNGSQDGSQAWMQEAYPQVGLYAAGHNLGFAAANNIGIRAAMAEGAAYVALLNNDTRVEPEWLDALVAAAEAHPDAAICQARQRTWDGSQEIRFHFIPQWGEAETEFTALARPGAPRPTAFASGCAMLLRCAALEQIGLLDARYFMYVEDVDLTLRAWIAGYAALDVAEAVVYHRLTSSPSTQPQRMFWGYRNQLTTLLKLYEPGTLRQFATPIRRRWFVTHNRVALRATLASLRMAAGTLARRAQIQKGRARPDAEFLGLCGI